MKELSSFSGQVEILFTDIDDTLTTHGQLHGEAYQKLWDLAEAGIQVVPVTGRPAGWCEMIARLWPVSGIIGENGAFYFRYHEQEMKRVFALDEKTRLENQTKLKQIQEEILNQVPGSALASDQFCRLFDLAIDFCEDVPALPPQDIQKIVDIFKHHGAVAKVSSIHVNGWFGNYDKRSMCEVFYEDIFKSKLSLNQSRCAFVGDSPNDEPLFDFFENSFAVNNILKFKDQIKSPPSYICSQEGGKGFAQLADHLIAQKNK